MKRKILITILSLAMGLSIVACGKQEITVTEENVTTETEAEAEKITTSNGDDKDTTTETSKIPESKG